MTRRWWVSPLVITAALAAAGPAVALLAGELVDFKERGPSSAEYVPGLRFAKAASFGFDNAAADLLWIETIQYFNEETLKPRKAGLKKGPLLKALADCITELDPHFHAAYGHISIFLRIFYRYDEAVDLLEKGMACNPGVFHYPYQLGTLYAFDLKDRPLSDAHLADGRFRTNRDVGAFYFSKAMQCSEKPEFFLRFFEGFMTGRGELEAVMAMYLNEHEEAEGYPALKDYWATKILRLMAVREIRDVQQGLKNVAGERGPLPPRRELPGSYSRGSLRDLGSWREFRAFRTPEVVEGSLPPFSDVILYNPDDRRLLSVHILRDVDESNRQLIRSALDNFIMARGVLPPPGARGVSALLQAGFLRREHLHPLGGKYVLDRDREPVPELGWDSELEALEKR